MNEEPEPATATDIEAEAPPAPAPEGDEYTLMSDGRIAIGFDAKRYVFRRPRLGEFRELRSAFVELAEQKGDDALDFAVKYVERTAAMLSDRPFPADADQWPTWLVAGMPFGDWLAHWRDVPLAPGGPTGP